jgi:transposase-like protein
MDTRNWLPSRAASGKVRLYEAIYLKASECLKKERDELLTFYDFPAEHWRHIRTTILIESTFATVRLRTKKFAAVSQPEP